MLRKPDSACPDRVVRGTIGVRAVGSEAGIEQWTRRGLRRITSSAPKPEALDDTGTEILDVDVGRLEQLPHDVAFGVCVEVELDASLVAVERLELRAVQAFLEAAKADRRARAARP